MRMEDLTYTRSGLIQAVDSYSYRDFLYFWKHEEAGDEVTKACLSQWYPSTFVIDGITYNCGEQFMMAEKARTFRDKETLAKILVATEPDVIKKLGRQVANFNPQVWDEKCIEAVYTGNMHKFSQNPRLKAFLLSTGDSTLAEASPYDKIWGVGLEEKDALKTSPHFWKGENKLGFILMEVRKKLREDCQKASSMTMETFCQFMMKPCRQQFPEMARYLINNLQIEKGATRYSLAEIEFYLYNEEDKDRHTYIRDTKAMKWFFHDSGLDIAFETLKEGKWFTQFGGILIRSIIKHEPGKEDETIAGPIRCQKEIFNHCDEFPKIIEKLVPTSYQVGKDIRYGFVEEDLSREYRFFIDEPEFNWNRRTEKAVYSYRTENGVKIFLGVEVKPVNEYYNKDVVPRQSSQRND